MLCATARWSEPKRLALRGMEARGPSTSRAPLKKFVAFRFGANAVLSWASLLSPNRVGIPPIKLKQWTVTETASLTTGRIHYAQSATRYRSRPIGRAGLRRACGRGPGQAGPGSQAMGDAAGGQRQYPVFEAQTDQLNQRQEAAGSLDVLDRRVARPRGRPAGGGRHDVRAHAASKYGLCA